MKTTLARMACWRRTDLYRMCGFFVTAACALIASAAMADTKLISNGSPVRYLVPSDGSLAGTWRAPSFDDTAWHRGTNGLGYETTPGAYTASIIADSEGDWSIAGQQGENSWIYGYYDKTGDADGIYQATDFQPFPRSDGSTRSETNFWGGDAYDWFPDDMPWDAIGQIFVHPNGVNSGGIEHWSIRRWVSTANGAVTVRFHLRKQNLSGTGVTGKVFKNGTELFSRAISGTDPVGYEVYINTTAAPGDVFDFALTPIGLGGDTADGADGSYMNATILSGTVQPPPPPPTPEVVADSVNDWSSTGVQGANGWYYGFWNKTADADGSYDPNTDFNTTDPNWNFSGQWQLGDAGDPNADPPWDNIGQSDWHPNGDNNGHVDWVIRRWVSDVDGDLYTHVKFGKQNVGGGNGTTLHILHQGTELFSQTVAFNNAAGIDVYVSIPNVFIGEKIEFALDPLGTDGSYADGADGSYINATIHTGPPPVTTVADSVNDWSTTGVQGANGWYYGFYNQTADADHTYNPNTDFNTTDPSWTFSGQWQLGVAGDPNADPPWDIIGQTDWHPNGDNNGHVDWVIKRWVSDVDGDLHAKVQFAKQNINGGNGTTLRVFQNGTQLYSHTVAFNDAVGIDVAIPLSNVFVGDKIEFALDPLGTDGSHSDGADGSVLRVSIRTGLPPEPPKPFVPGIADCIATDLKAAMHGVNSSVFIRIPFDVANPAAIETLKLKIKYNDGFAAYLNGVEIAKRNAPIAISGVVADSIADWSTNPDVTVNGWSYGYYDQSLDADATYSGAFDFAPFPHDGTGVPSATEFWNGSGYDWYAGDPPWTELYQEDVHPNSPHGTFNPNDPATHTHWAIRRWSSPVDANLKARVRFRKRNLNGGDGVRVSLFHGGVQIYSQTIGGTDGVGRDDTVDVPSVFIGDNIDLLLGPGDNDNDGADGSKFSLVLFEGEPSIPWDAKATASRTTTESITPETIDLTSLISHLTPGVNVLAIQGINGAVDDNEFLINAELLANRVPTAQNDAVVATVNTPITYPASVFLNNDSDPDGDHLLLVGVTPTYTTAQGGTVRLYGDTVRYAPPANFTGTDSFSYTMTDLSGTPVRASVSVNVKAANTCPTASPLAIGVEQDGTVNFQLPASDPDGDPLQYSITQPPAHGVLVLQTSTGSGSYTPTARYCGPDSFKFKVTDGACESAEATVSITVTNCNACPTANPASLTVDQDSTGNNFQLQASDPDGNSLQYSITQPPAHGVVVLNVQTGAGNYTPNAGYCGPDSFKYRVTDGRCQSAAATVSITVRCGNQPPACVARVACALTFANDPNAYVISLNGSNACVVLDASQSTDPEGDPLSFQWYVEPSPAPFAGGSVATNCMDAGCQTIRVVVTDSHGASCSRSLQVCVVAACDVVERVIDQIDGSNLSRKVKRPLIASLKAACANFELGEFVPAMNALEAFQHKVDAQLGRTDPATAAALNDGVQKILDAIDCAARLAGGGQ